MVDYCNIIRFPTEWNMRREPMRPVELRKDYFNGMKFNENFDWDNLWYDAVQLHQSCIVLIGPPLYHTSNQLPTKCKFTDDNNVALSFRSFEMDRAGMTAINTTGWVNNLKMISNTETVIPVNRICEDFNDRYCMFTLQKDNPISWIKQWITYHHVNFGIDGILIYDNGSKGYSLDDLESQLQTPGVVVKVVSWDMPYGPQGFDCNYYNTWDSDYAQSSMFEHAKRRYLSNAKIAINADVDELLAMSYSTLDDVINHINQEGVAGYCYKGRWIEPYDLANNKPAYEVSLGDRQFIDYYCTDSRNIIGIGNKWMLIPGKALNSQWVVHSTGAAMRQNHDIYYGHYMPMNTNWSWDRDGFDGDATGLVADEKLMNNLSKIRDN